MKANDAAPDSIGQQEGAAVQSIKSAWKPSGALHNPDPSIADLEVDEYKACCEKSDFFRPAAKVPKKDGGYQCSLFEARHTEEIPDVPDGRFHQDPPAKPDKMLPILSVSGCMFICKRRCVCVVDCACMINNAVLVPLPG